MHCYHKTEHGERILRDGKFSDDDKTAVPGAKGFSFHRGVWLTGEDLPPLGNGRWIFCLDVPREILEREEYEMEPGECSWLVPARTLNAICKPDHYYTPEGERHEPKSNRP